MSATSRHFTLRLMNVRYRKEVIGMPWPLTSRSQPKRYSIGTRVAGRARLPISGPACTAGRASAPIVTGTMFGFARETY